MNFKNQSLDLKQFEKWGFTYRSVNFKPTDALGDGNFLFRYLVFIEFITFNDYLELSKDIVVMMRNFLQDDSDIDIILKYFFKYKCRPAKQVWTDEFTTK